MADAQELALLGGGKEDVVGLRSKQLRAQRHAAYTHQRSYG